MNASTAVALAPPNNQSREISATREPLTFDLEMIVEHFDRA